MKYKAMICYLLLLTGLLTAIAATAVSGQSQRQRIGEIEFFGYQGLDLDRVRAALPVHEGDSLPSSPELIPETEERIKAAIKRSAGYRVTDVQTVCCDDQGNGLIYIGLPGQSSKGFTYTPAPKGK